ncbi:MAG TPA: PEGA domain-containing protein, partial [Candidatus Saccharimonadales bacterium]
MQTQAERRQALIWRIIRYVIMVLAIITLTISLIFLMLGYRFNRDNGTIVQGGLVQFISQPTGAKVTVGAAQLANPTRSKITLYPGDYLVKMERPGYDLWQKSITVRAGTVLWLDSARLVPTNRSTSSVKSFPVLADTLVRASGNYMALLPDTTKPSIILAPLTDANEIMEKQVVIPSGVVAQGKKSVKHSYSFVEWSRNDRHLILEHTYGKEREFLLVDTDAPEKTTAVQPIGKVVPVEATFDPRSATDMVVRYSDGTVRLV